MSSPTMSVRRIAPFLPFYSSNGNTVIATWEELSVTRHGLRHKIIWVRYRDKKGKESEAVKQVIWIDEPFAEAGRKV
ncbi:MAG: hypothetical protein RSD49_08335 [Hafnia sp.]